MFAILTRIDVPMLLDGLAIACSLILILFLLANRRRYGRLLLDRPGVRKKVQFSDQLSLQMMSQQSQKAYANLQQTLKQEFESLRLMGASTLSNEPSANSDQEAAREAGHHNNRRRRYCMAREMIARSDAVPQILQQCDLSEGELELLQGLRQLEGHEDHQTKRPMEILA